MIGSNGSAVDVGRRMSSIKGSDYIISSTLKKKKLSPSFVLVFLRLRAFFQGPH